MRIFYIGIIIVLNSCVVGQNRKVVIEPYGDEKIGFLARHIYENEVDSVEWKRNVEFGTEIILFDVIDEIYFDSAITIIRDALIDYKSYELDSCVRGMRVYYTNRSGKLKNSFCLCDKFTILERTNYLVDKFKWRKWSGPIIDGFGAIHKVISELPDRKR